MFHRILPRDFAGGFVNWRLVVLHHVAKALGLLVHVEGFPYGTSRNLNRSPMTLGNAGATVSDSFEALTSRNQIGG